MGDSMNAENRVAYSRGKNKFDNKPDQRVAVDFKVFMDALWADKSAEKGSTFICAPMIEGSHNDPEKYPGVQSWRQKHLAGRRCWQPFDIDYLAGPEALGELLRTISVYHGIAYTTASSTRESPRIRVILETSREMKYEESELVGAALEGKIYEQMGNRIKFDRSVYRGEQPCYLPTNGAERYDLQGEALQVDVLIAEIAPRQQKEPAKALAKESAAKDRGSYENWIADMLSGENVHDGAIRIVGRLVAEGASDQTIWTFFRLAADTIANNRGDQRVWELLDQGELNRMINGARSKGFAPDRSSEFVLKPVDQFVREGFSDDWYIDEVIPKAALGLIYGASGSGKSFLAIDMMVAIAQGKTWHGHQSRRARIIYIAAEGVVGVKKRFMAQEVSGLVDLASLGIKIVDVAPNFLQDDDVALAQAIEASGGADIVVVDTLAQVLPGANENSSEDMGAALARCKRLNEATGAMVILVHHSGKDASKGARGWSGIKGALDVELEVSNGSMCRSAKVTKLKDGEDMAVFHFNLLPVSLGYRENGKRITSCIVKEAYPSMIKMLRPSGEWQKRIWSHVKKLVDEGDYEISINSIVDYIKSTTEPTGDKDRRRDSVIRAMNNMADSGFFSIKDGVIKVDRTDLSVYEEADHE